MLNNTLTPFLFLAVSVGLFYTYLNPGYAKIQNLRADEAEYIEALDRVKEIQTIRDDLLDKFNDISEEDLKKLETLLPDEVDHVKLLLDLDGIAKKYDIEIKTVRVSRPLDGVQALDPTAQVKPYGSLAVSFMFEATYEDFSQFMKEVESSLKIIDVTSVNFSAAEGDLLKFTVGIKTYWLKK